MAEAPRLAAALRYQQELDDPTRPATVNPMMARQVAKSRELMTAPTSIMDERYPAWKKAQENADLFLLGADAAGLSPFAAKGATVAAKFAAPKLAQGLEQHMIRSGMMLPIDVYHGTPHRFAPTAKNPLGEFDPTKIGTGEGAQAYGYGHYVAESPNVAKGYQAATSKDKFLTSNGFFDPSSIEHLNVRAEIRKGDLNKAIETAKKYATPDADYPETAAKAMRDLQKLEQLKISGGIRVNQGNLYKVDLPDEVVPRMLDWDKPLSEQSNIIKNINPKNLGLTYTQLPNGNHAYVNANGEIIGNLQKGGTKEGFANNWIQATLEGTGRTLYNQLGQGMGGSEKTSKALLNAGIPGIQYLDAGSRGANAGTGTRNFVVFPGNEGLLNILGRE